MKVFFDFLFLLLCHTTKDRFLEFSDKRFVGFITPDLEGSTNVFQIVIMTNLSENSWSKDFMTGRENGFVFVTHKSSNFVVAVVYFGKELSVGLIVLTTGEETDRNVMCEIIYTVDESDFLLVAFDLHIFSVHQKNSTPSISSTVLCCDDFVCRDFFEL